MLGVFSSTFVVRILYDWWLLLLFIVYIIYTETTQYFVISSFLSQSKHKKAYDIKKKNEIVHWVKKRNSFFKWYKRYIIVNSVIMLFICWVTLDGRILTTTWINYETLERLVALPSYRGRGPTLLKVNMLNYNIYKNIYRITNCSPDYLVCVCVCVCELCECECLLVARSAPTSSLT